MDVAAAERLAGALPRLQRVVLAGLPDLSGPSSQGVEHVAGIIRLRELLGPRARLAW